MKNIEIYTLDYCPYCQKAKFFLEELNIKYKEYSCDDNEEEMRLKLKEKYNLSGLATFPQIIIDGVNIGGYSDLIEKYNSKEISFNYDKCFLMLEIMALFCIIPAINSLTSPSLKIKTLGSEEIPNSRAVFIFLSASIL